MEKNWDNCEACSRICIAHGGRNFVATRWDLESIYCMESSAWETLRNYASTGDAACKEAIVKAVCHDSFIENEEGVWVRRVVLGASP